MKQPSNNLAGSDVAEVAIVFRCGALRAWHYWLFILNFTAQQLI